MAWVFQGLPKHIRDAAGVAPGSEVSFSLEGSKIVITPVGTGFKEDRRAKLREAAAKVRGSLSAEFRQLGADEMMNFIRGDEPTDTSLSSCNHAVSVTHCTSISSSTQSC